MFLEQLQMYSYIFKKKKHWSSMVDMPRRVGHARPKHESSMVARPRLEAGIVARPKRLGLTMYLLLFYLTIH